MNRKRHKKGLNSKTKNGKPEVFVLPPNLLHKLGINLGNIEPSQEYPPNIVLDADNNAEVVNEQIPNISETQELNLCKKLDESSILETAILMKNSVLLSPTFIPTVSNVIPGEVEIASILKESENSIFMADLENSNNELSSDNKNIVNDGHSTLDDHKQIENNKKPHSIGVRLISLGQGLDTENYNNNYQVNIDKSNNSILATPVRNHIGVTTTNGILITNEGISFHDHSDEAYLSDCSNSNMGSNTQYLPEMRLCIPQKQKLANKINIISEEIIDASQMNEFRTIHSPSALTPVTVNTIISKKKTNSICDTESPNVNKPMTFTKISDKELQSQNIPDAPSIEKTVSTEINIDNERMTLVTEKIFPNRNNNSADASNEEALLTNGLENVCGENNLLTIKDYSLKGEDIFEMHVFYKEGNEKLVKKYNNNEKSGMGQLNCVLENNTPVPENNNQINKVLNKQIFESSSVKCSNIINDQQTMDRSKSTVGKNNQQNNSNLIITGLDSILSHSRGNVKINNNSCINSTDEKVIEKSQHLGMEDTDNNTIMNSDNSNVPVSKIKEIATYLSKLVKKENILNKTNNKNKKMKPKVHTIKSKLCIQGVEKPGGVQNNEEIMINPKIIRTYAKLTKTQRPRVPATIYEPNNEVLDNSSVDSKTNDVYLVPLPKIQEFCICEDFGRLAYYEYDNLYEHLHFWEHKSVDCTSDALFSIYNDNNTTVNIGNAESTINYAPDDDNNIQVQENKGFNICWYDLEYENESSKNVDFSSHTASTSLNAGVSEMKNSRLTSTEIHNFNRNFDNITDKIIYTTVNEVSSTADITSESKDKKETEVHTNPENLNVEKSIYLKNNVHNSSGTAAEMSEETYKSISQVPSECDETRNNKVYVDIETSDSTQVTDNQNDNKIDSVMDKTAENNTTSKAKKALKRRKSLFNTTQNANKSEEPPCKKTIMCGVCSQVLSEVNWEDHVTKEHDHIAWREGHSIDFEDADLLRKLGQKLQNIGFLKCTYCSMEIKYLKKFIPHVKKCMNSTELSITSNTENNDAPSTTCSKNGRAKCGVCKLDVEPSLWINHISQEHNYLAWKDPEPALILDDKELVRQHLQNIVKKHGGLTCSKCGLFRKYVKSYLTHIKNCHGNDKESLDNSTNSVELNNTNDLIIKNNEKPNKQLPEKEIKCGVCEQEVENKAWIEHISKEHNYLAWQNGEAPLELQDETFVWHHLNNIAKQNGGLICGKCGLNRKYVKAYLQHVKSCEGTIVQECLDETNTSMLDEVEAHIDEVVKCGVCQKQVEGSVWIDHIQIAHNYIAWIDGKKPIDPKDEERVHQHLLTIIKKVGELTCMKCGIVRKYLKSYLHHIESCEGTGFTCEDPSLNSGSKNKDEYECAVCFKKGKRKEWKEHAMKKHYNIAWIVGEIPIDIKNPYVVEKFLKEYKQKFNQLVCRICGTTRISCVGFYAHILTCGKTEEELESWKNICEICNNKYLCIYKTQHIAMHKEQEYKKERKLKAAEEKKKDVIEEVPEHAFGRRRAAEKARNVIEKYKNTINECSQSCSTCGLVFENDEKCNNHKCAEKEQGYSSESDVSVKLEHCSDDDSPDTDIDSNVSDEEDEETGRKSHRNRESSISSPRITRMPFSVTNISSYLQKSYEDFCNLHFTSESLFTQWHSCECEAVPEDETSQYLPPLNESCKVKFADDSWTTYSRFEAKKGNGFSIFVGGSIQCISWVPPHAEDRQGSCGNYLAVACHAAVDCPRYQCDDIVQQPGLLQIWDFGDFVRSLPKFVLGLAHDYGIVWAMAWCPSGARDLTDTTHEAGAENTLRLGLLAIACSNGSAYIFSVPYPASKTEKDKVIYKLKPVAELRLLMSTERKTFQATSLCWSTQKDHAIIIVGYSDGTTAFYDLKSDSPLLKSYENNVTILYPYHDDRPQNTCITGVDMFPGGAVCSASPTGAGALAGAAGAAGAGAGAGGAAVRSHLPASGAVFAPHWPAVLLSGDDLIVNKSVNELEWWGGGRRLGGAGAWGACGRCARAAAAAPPLLRLVRAHPAHRDLLKQVIAVIHMTPLGENRKRKQTNDNLAMKLEPLTYDDAVKKYGIEFKIIPNKTAGKKARSLPTELRPERYPLSDVPALAFCSTPRHHDRLAVATHAGLIFLITV